MRGQSSRPFDGEGVEGEKLVMVEDGVLKHWFLSTSAARELGLETNGRGVRGGSSVSPSSTNLAIEPGDKSPEELIKAVETGFYVTEVFGQGVNMVTGEYSRGATGFWIENGELAYPVSEVTIASNLKEMFLSMMPANDLDRNFGTAAPTLADRRNDPCRQLTPANCRYASADLALIGDARAEAGRIAHALLQAQIPKSG